MADVYPAFRASNKQLFHRHSVDHVDEIRLCTFIAYKRALWQRSDVGDEIRHCLQIDLAF